MSESKVDSLNETDPNVAAEAPLECLAGGPSDMEEAVDDVEFPEAVVLVGKNHWRCVTCMSYHSLSSSIDQHIQAHHIRQTSASRRGRGRGSSRSAGRPSREASAPVKPSKLSTAYLVRSLDTKNSAGDAQAELVTGRSLRKVEGGSSEHNLSSHTMPFTHLSRGRSGSKWVKTSRGRQTVRGGRGGRGTRGRGARGGRGKAMRGRGRLVSNKRPPDSDTETECMPTEQPQSTTGGKRKSRDGEGTQLHDTDEEPASKTLKQAKSVSEEQLNRHSASPGGAAHASVENTDESQNTNTEEGVRRNADEHSRNDELLNNSSSEAHDDETRAATSLKTKYLVVVEKAGAASHFSELEAAITEVDPTIPIETPSLQADALIPPATPVLPEIHGPPETPVPPETPQQPEVVHPPEVPATLESTDTESASEIGRFCGSRPESESRDYQLPVASPGEPGHAVGANKSTSLHFSCKICQTVFESQADVKTHLSEVSKFDIVVCNECGEKFHGLHQLNMHIFSSHEKFTQKFCILCGMEVQDIFELEEHLLEHTLTGSEAEKDGDNSDFFSHTCKVCGIEIELLESNISDLVTHYHVAHDQFICTTCKECFTDITAYQDHKLTHVSDEKNCEAVVFACPVSGCFQMCEDKEVLRDHISWHEDQFTGEEVPLLPCTMCNNHFRSKVSLLRHLFGMHNIQNIKPFICELCNDEFAQSLDLYHHNIHNHPGITRYSCPYCPQYFAFRSSFRRHVASQHDVAATILRL